MKLEEILKTLKKGERIKYETSDGQKAITAYINDLDEYSIILHINFESMGIYIGSFAKIENVIECLKDFYAYEWTEVEFEVYKNRAELKAEIKKLKEILLEACDLIDCAYCPISMNCSDVDDCKYQIFEWFLNK